MAVNGVNQQLSGLIDRFSYMRTGTVEAVDPFLATVTVGDTVIRAAYVRQSEPPVGDVVAVMRQNASWFVMGTTSVSGGNSVQNPSFEDVNEDQTPVFWTLYNATGVSEMQAVYEPDESVPGLDGNAGNVLSVGPVGGATASSRVYSAPIGVVPGQVWELSCYVNGDYPSVDPDTTDVSLHAFWFANATDLYPTTSDTDTTVASINDVTEEEIMHVMRGNVTVPAGGVFMRVGLRTAALAYTGAHFDFVTARQVS